MRRWTPTRKKERIFVESYPALLHSSQFAGSRQATAALKAEPGGGADSKVAHVESSALRSFSFPREGELCDEVTTDHASCHRP